MTSKETENKLKLPEKLEFEIQEFIFYEKGLYWYLFALALLGVIVWWSVVSKDIFLTVIILLGATVFYQLAITKPNKVKVGLSSEGIIYKSKIYGWSMFKSFSVFSSVKHGVISFEKLAWAAGPLIITLPNQGKSTHVKTTNANISDQNMFLSIVSGFLPERFNARLSLGEWLNKVTKF